MPFTKGHSGNPAGRTPKRVHFERPIAQAEKRIVDVLPHIVDKMLELVEGVMVQDTDSHGDAVVYQRPPDRAAAEYLLNRIMGRPTEHAEVSGPDGAPIVFTLNLGEAEPAD
jgi:hypothetical protein